MADKDLIEAVVAAACAAAGPVGGASPAWKMKVNELVPEVAALLSEGSKAWRTAESILDADHISGTYIGCEMEESSTRLIVTILANNAQEAETLRTPRTDEPEGKRMQNKLSYVNEGDRIHIWKVVEQMRNDPNKKVRYIGHFESYGPPRDAVPAPAPRPVTAPGSGGTLIAAGDALIAAGDRLAAEVNAFKDLAEAVNNLSTVQKLAVRNGASKLGIVNFMQPADEEERGTVLRLIKEQTNATGNP